MGPFDRMAYLTILFVFLWAVISIAQNSSLDYSRSTQSILDNHKAQLSDSSQCLIAVNKDSASIQATLFVMEKIGQQWKEVIPSFPVNIGKRGFAAPDQKAEGDGRSPTGIYLLGTSFGYESSIKSKMPYRQAGAEDFWVDDPNSSQYNTWVHGRPDAASFEYMLRKDHQYKYGIVVQYNLDPVVKGKGSAIFIHVWRSPGAPTAGCVAMAEEDIVKLLEWLDPQKRPRIIMGALPDLLK